MMNCSRCGKPAHRLITYGDTGEKICMSCIEKEAAKGEICPNCGHEIDEADLVGIKLNHKNKSAQEIEANIEATAIICPNCRVIFFDRFQYAIIQGLREP